MGLEVLVWVWTILCNNLYVVRRQKDSRKNQEISSIADLYSLIKNKVRIQEFQLSMIGSTLHTE